MKYFPTILFKGAMTLALMVGLITTVLFSGQKANSAGPTASQTQGYFFCIAGCTKNFTCPLEEDCICNDQPAARSRFVDICKNQPPDEISGACVNCSSKVDPKKAEDSTNCVSYSSGGEHEGWCGCKITCPTPTPTPPEDCGQRDAGSCNGGSCHYTSDPTDYCAQTKDYMDRSICACVTPTPSGSSNAGTLNQGHENETPPEGEVFLPEPNGTP